MPRPYQRDPMAAWCSNGSLYGNELTGSGAYSDGALFKFNPVTNVLTPLVAFSGSNVAAVAGSMIKVSMECCME